VHAATATAPELPPVRADSPEPEPLPHRKSLNPAGAGSTTPYAASTQWPADMGQVAAMPRADTAEQP
jgi:hypothetical protein